MIERSPCVTQKRSGAGATHQSNMGTSPRRPPLPAFSSKVEKRLVVGHERVASGRSTRQYPQCSEWNLRTRDYELRPWWGAMSNPCRWPHRVEQAPHAGTFYTLLSCPPARAEQPARYPAGRSRVLVLLVSRPQRLRRRLRDWRQG
jgi:hypothetical protein